MEFSFVRRCRFEFWTARTPVSGLRKEMEVMPHKFYDNPDLVLCNKKLHRGEIINK